MLSGTLNLHSINLVLLLVRDEYCTQNKALYKRPVYSTLPVLDQYTEHDTCAQTLTN